MKVRDLDFQMEQKPWTAEDNAKLRALWDQFGGRATKIGKIMGRTKGAIVGKSRRMQLQFHGTKATKALKKDHPAALNAATKYTSRVALPALGLLKSGDNQRKLGKVVTKGPWKGMPIFSLTLQERATCPRSCAMWLSCYGNSMGYAKRYSHGIALVEAIHADLRHLQENNPLGFVVRLHILGDFFSVNYVTFWRYMLEEFPALRVFGYTARQEGTRIGDAIAHLRRQCWARFAVRTSGASAGPRTAVIASEADRAGAIICPSQTGKTSNCSTCGLCWSPTAKDKPIAFLKH